MVWNGNYFLKLSIISFGTFNNLVCLQQKQIYSLSNALALKCTNKIGTQTSHGLWGANMTPVWRSMSTSEDKVPQKQASTWPTPTQP
jgi:hypothetical protein